MLISLLSPDQPTTDFHGTYYDVIDARCDATPIQRPHSPVVIGHNGEKSTLRTLARYPLPAAALSDVAD